MKGKKNKKIIAIASIFAVLVVVGVVGYIWYTSTQNVVQEDTETVATLKADEDRIRDEKVGGITATEGSDTAKRYVDDLVSNDKISEKQADAHKYDIASRDGNYAEATTYAEKLYKNDTKDQANILKLMEAYANTEKKEEAQKLYQEALAGLDKNSSTYEDDKHSLVYFANYLGLETGE